MRGSFGHFCKYLLKSYCVPGPALDTEDSTFLTLSSDEGEAFPRKTLDQNFIMLKTLLKTSVRVRRG